MGVRLKWSRAVREIRNKGDCKMASVINGDHVFAVLSSMTEEQRKRCVFPGFWDDKEFEFFRQETAENRTESEEGADKVNAIPVAKISEIFAKVVGGCIADAWWASYHDAIESEVADHIQHEILG